MRVLGLSGSDSVLVFGGHDIPCVRRFTVRISRGEDGLGVYRIPEHPDAGLRFTAVKAETTPARIVAALDIPPQSLRLESLYRAVS